MTSSELPLAARERGGLALTDTLAVMLPTAEQTLLLQACLLDGSDGRLAWEAWRARVNDPKAALADDPDGANALLPLLYHNCQRNGTPIERALMPYLRTAYFREELRAQHYRRICAAVLSSLTHAGVRSMLLLETALAATVYGNWALRHCHQMDILVQGDVRRAVDALTEAGCTPSGVPRRETARFSHASGLPVVVHSSLFDALLGSGSRPDFWNRSRGLTIDGVQTRVLAPTDALLHHCGWVSSGRRRLALQGTCDIWHLIARSSDLKWHDLVHALGENRLALPAYVVLRYIALELDAPIPRDVLDDLRSVANKTDRLGQDIALRAARSASGAGFIHLLRQTPGWQNRARIMRSMLLPTPAYVWNTQQVRRPWQIPWYYAYRPLRFLAWRGRSVLSRRDRSGQSAEHNA